MKKKTKTKTKTKAKLLPLENKYCGTKVQIDDCTTPTTFWLTNEEDRFGGSSTPSERELNKAGITYTQWVNNTQIILWDQLDEKGNPVAVNAKDLIDPDNFEDEFSYQTALNFIHSFNSQQNSSHNQTLNKIETTQDSSIETTMPPNNLVSGLLSFGS
jgi:hypothetical protein